MKKTVNLIIFLYILIVNLKCEKSPIDPEQKLFTVSGKVFNSHGPIQNATVGLDNILDWTVKTSSKGVFIIKNVKAGEYNLYMEQINEDGSFVEKSKKISVYSNISLDSLFLPYPVLLYAPSDISMSSIKLTWQTTATDDFNEYKLFRGDTPALDDINGELIYVSTNRSDTTFTDKNLLSQRTYYYRIYLMNQSYKISGSNTVNAQTTDKPQIGNWKRINSPTNESLYYLFFVDSQTGWAVSNSYGHDSILKTINGGEDWIIQYVSNQRITSIHFIDEKKGWLGIWGNVIMKTEDGGNTWIEQNIPVDKGRTVFFIDENIGWFGGISNGIYKTNNGGITWAKQISANFNETITYLFFLDSEIGWASSEQSFSIGMVSGIESYIYSTTNGGDNWIKSERISSSQINKIQFLSPLNGFLNSGGIFKTDDGGKTWIKIHEHNSKDLSFINNYAGWIVGLWMADIGNAIGYTIDGGLNWEYVKVNDYLNSIFFFDLDNGWAVGSQGIILKYYH